MTEPVLRSRSSSSWRSELEYRTWRIEYGLRTPSRTNSPPAVAANAIAHKSAAVKPLM